MSRNLNFLLLVLLFLLLLSPGRPVSADPSSDAMLTLQRPRPALIGPSQSDPQMLDGFPAVAAQFGLDAELDASLSEDETIVAEPDEFDDGDTGTYYAPKAAPLGLDWDATEYALGAFPFSGSPRIGRG